MVAVTGASGAIYAKRLLEILPDAYDTVYLTASENALQIIRDETGINSLAEFVPNKNSQKCVVLGSNDMYAPPASGSHEYDGLICIPCSMGVVGRIASGISNDLVTRCADVCLKERRKLIIVARETPFSLVHLRNLTTIAEAGGTILPAAPAFYGNPSRIDDLVDFVVDRVLRSVGSDIRLMKGWGE